ncbi:hydroxyectoine utilization dehydratase EutB [Nisaea denitrificans]|uniref:hydroxyectoine utilization dehydratase EutB n=1 Tax=Nisaea denitrificans TaxID=390877 RepID=UPI00055A05DA|nr:hydroxyectoine utilization dehydratase EutB [Nisaea denitrificans]
MSDWRRELSLENVTAARAAIAGIAVETPLVPSPFLSSMAGMEVLLKLEIAQPIGAFKIRGAANAISVLPGDCPGVTCCSTGNHGRGVAYAARARGLRAIICMSELVPDAKVEGIRALGAEVRIVGRSQDEAAEESRRLVAQEGLAEIPPFDDPLVIAGQGTIGLELLDSRPDLETLLIPLSGGGLAAGIALAAKARKPGIRVIGISMDRGAAMYESLQAGRNVAVEEVPSLADSLGGGLGADNRLTLPLCRALIDDTVLVTEAEIYRAMQCHYYEDRMVCEGGSAVGAAALLAGKLPDLEGPVATIITGRNLDMNMHADIMAGRTIRLGDLTLEGKPYHA